MDVIHLYCLFPPVVRLPLVLYVFYFRPPVRRHLLKYLWWIFDRFTTLGSLRRLLPPSLVTPPWFPSLPSSLLFALTAPAELISNPGSMLFPRRSRDCHGCKSRKSHARREGERLHPQPAPPASQSASTHEQSVSQVYYSIIMGKNIIGTNGAS